MFSFLLWLLLGLSTAQAQNVTCATRLPGDATNACASTAFVHNGYTPIPGNYTTGLPLIGNGTPYPVQGTVSGTTNEFGTVNGGAHVDGHCVSWNSGNLVDSGDVCGGSGGAGTVTSGITGQYAYYPENGTTVAGTFFPAPIPNASGSSQNTTADCVSGNTSVTLTGAIDFANGQGISLEHCGATFSGSAPTGLTVSASGSTGQGPTGSTTYAYQIACVDATGGVGQAITAVSISNGAATLGVVSQSTQKVAYNLVTWATTCPGVAVWRNIAGAGYHLIGIFGAYSFTGVTDDGISPVTIPWIPDTPTAAPLNDRLVTSISSGAGTTAVTVSDAPINSTTGSYARHDDTAAILSYLNAVQDAVISPGTYNIETITIPTTVKTFHGASPAGTVINGWSTASTTLIATSMPDGFILSGLTITPLARGNANGVDLSSTVHCTLQNLILSGAAALTLDSVTDCNIVDNKFNNWYRYAFIDTSGARNIVARNNAASGLERISSVGYQLSSVYNDILSNNIIMGGEYFAFYLTNSFSNVLEGNTSYYSLHENYHLSGTGSFNLFSGNYAYDGTSSIDYCFSASDDDVNSVSQIANAFKNNYLFECGTSAIAIVQLAGTSPAFDYWVISGNTIINANADQLASQSDILLGGSAINSTMINGNTFLNGRSIHPAYNIREINLNGVPVYTQVGANFGNQGSSGYTSLSGTGSTKLTAGSTGL